jgi:hypothetical protein
MKKKSFTNFKKCSASIQHAGLALASLPAAVYIIQEMGTKVHPGKNEILWVFISC